MDDEASPPRYMTQLAREGFAEYAEEAMLIANDETAPPYLRNAMRLQADILLWDLEVEV